MCERIDGKCDVIVPRFEEGWEPLHAIYSKNCLTSILKRIHEKDLRIVSFFQDVTLDVITKKDFEILSLPHEVLYNINTQEDIERAILMVKEIEAL
jgi:molybdopterin-guanine dinucleotide biosynthesis protein A